MFQNPAHADDSVKALKTAQHTRTVPRGHDLLNAVFITTGMLVRCDIVQLGSLKLGPDKTVSVQRAQIIPFAQNAQRMWAYFGKVNDFGCAACSVSGNAVSYMTRTSKIAGEGVTPPALNNGMCVHVCRYPV